MANPYDISRLLESVGNLDEDDDDIDRSENKSIMTKDSLEKNKKPAENKKPTGTSSSKSKKGSKKKVGGSSSGGGGLSLGASLQKIAGPSLSRKDFGRGADDNDTFCGLGTVGEKEMAKSPFSKEAPTAAASPTKVKTVKRSQVTPPSKSSSSKNSSKNTEDSTPPSSTLSSSKNKTKNNTTSLSSPGSMFQRRQNDDDSEDDDDPDNDQFFEKFDSNPFKMSSR